MKRTVCAGWSVSFGECQEKTSDRGVYVDGFRVGIDRNVETVFKFGGGHLHGETSLSSVLLSGLPLKLSRRSNSCRKTARAY